MNSSGTLSTLPRPSTFANFIQVSTLKNFLYEYQATMIINATINMAIML